MSEKVVKRFADSETVYKNNYPVPNQKYTHWVEFTDGTQVEKLVSKMDFCKAHNFEEEFRIANVEYQAVNMCVYRWREMHKEIKDVLNAWLF